MPGNAHRLDQNKQPLPEDFSSTVLKQVNHHSQAVYEKAELFFYNRYPVAVPAHNKMKKAKRSIQTILKNAQEIFAS